MPKWLAILLAIGLVSSVVSAQPDTARALPAVEIRAAPLGQTGLSVWEADTLPVSQVLTLADRLMLENTLSVRSGGPGLLATLSARGGGPSRTAVLWHGLNLQSPMNGVVDAALIPLWPGDRLEVLSGGQSAAQSTGAMAGIVRITPASLNDRLGWSGSLAAGAGTAGRLDGQVSLNFKGTALGTMIRGGWQRANNDFVFRNTALLGNPRQHQTNNFGERLDIQQFNEVQISPHHQLKTAFWHQRAYRQIPPSMTESATDTWQRDRSTRASLSWMVSPRPRVQWQHRLALLDDRIAFFLNGATDSSRSTTFLATSECLAGIGSHLSIRPALTAWWQRAKADGYGDSLNWFRQRRIAGQMTVEYHRPALSVQMILRQELAEAQAAPFTWSVGSEWTAKYGLTVRGQVSRNFNLPTFNDRFWRSLGKSDLKPESGYGAEAGIQWRHGRFSAGLTLFHLLLDNWILWQPGPDGQFRPGNLRQVWSRGAAWSVARTFDWLDCHWELTGRYQFVRATNTAVYAGNSSAWSKVLPYTPQHNGSFSLQWKHKRWSAACLHQWTGKRYTTSDNTGTLPGFITGNLLVGYSFRLAGQTLTCDARVENCWNAAYQILEYRPMPGRSVHLGIVWKW